MCMGGALGWGKVDSNSVGGAHSPYHVGEYDVSENLDFFDWAISTKNHNCKSVKHFIAYTLYVGKLML